MTADTATAPKGIGPLRPEDTQVLANLIHKPPEPQYILYHNGRGLITPGIVAQLAAAGGTGKTRLMTKLAAHCAAGTPFGMFTTPRPLKVLMINAEENQDQLDLMLWKACGGIFPKNLHAKSVKGVVGPLMALDGNLPIRTEWFNWLNDTIKEHSPLDLLMLDPKSRLYGLEENSNDHNTQWVASLESTTVAHPPLSILFSHHVPKGTKEISQWMGRGGGALTDACRFNMGVVGLSKKECERYGIFECKKYIKIGISKTNIGPQDRGDACFKFDDEGTLKPVYLERERLNSFKGAFLDILKRDGGHYSRRELRREPLTKHIIDEMNEQFDNFKRSEDLNPLLDLLLEECSLTERSEAVGPKRHPKRTLRIWNHTG